MQRVEFIPAPLNDVKKYDNYNNGIKTIYNYKIKYVSVILVSGGREVDYN